MMRASNHLPLSHATYLLVRSLRILRPIFCFHMLEHRTNLPYFTRNSPKFTPILVIRKKPDSHPTLVPAFKRAQDVRKNNQQKYQNQILSKAETEPSIVLPVKRSNSSSRGRIFCARVRNVCSKPSPASPFTTPTPVLNI
jgi:hypothetical protein